MDDVSHWLPPVALGLCAKLAHAHGPSQHLHAMKRLRPMCAPYRFVRISLFSTGRPAGTREFRLAMQLAAIGRFTASNFVNRRLIHAGIAQFL